MSRPNDWPERLSAFIESRRNSAFSWDENNCGFFAADWVKKLTGIDVAEGYRGESALAIMRQVRAGGGTDAMFDAVATSHDWACVSPAQASRGDVVSCLTPRGYALGVCLGARSAFMQKHGIGFVNTATCARAWRIE